MKVPLKLLYVLCVTCVILALITAWESHKKSCGIVFNSIIDGAFGDERNFVSVQEYLADGERQNAWEPDEIEVKNGAIYTIRAYVHNNALYGYDSVAKDVKVALSIPVDPAKSIPVYGFLSSSNSSPDRYWDEVIFKSESNQFHLEYIYNSARLENNGVGKNGGIQLSDEIVTKAASKNGALIGYDALDGEIPGGEQYASSASVQVMAVFDTDYTITSKVRVIGGVKEWTDYVEAEIGDIIEFQMEYQNKSVTGEIQNDVGIRDILPSNLEYVPGTTKIWNEFYDGSVITPDGSIVGNGINIGGYNPGAGAYLRFRAKVVDQDLGVGTNTLVNWSQCGVGKITIQDYASVIVTKEA